MLIDQIWDIMSISGNKMSKRNFKTLVCCIQNLWQPNWMMKQDNDPSPLKQKKFDLSQEEDTPLKEDKRSTMDDAYSSHPRMTGTGARQSAKITPLLSTTSENKQQ